jgi:hypothetical protein
MFHLKRELATRAIRIRFLVNHLALTVMVIVVIIIIIIAALLCATVINNLIP